MTIDKVHKFANDGSYESIQRQLEGMASKFFARVSAIGIAMDRDDVVQELRICYLKTRSTWKPDGGARFSTYFQTCAWRHLNTRIAKEEAERAQFGMHSYQGLDSGASGERAADGLLDRMEANGETEDSIEDARIRIDEMRERMAALSSDGRLLVVKLLVAERNKVDLKLSEICVNAQITGDRLKAVRAELRGSFGVVWR